MDSIGPKPTVVIANPNAARLRRERDSVARLARITAGKASLWLPAGLAELERGCSQVAVTGARGIVVAGGDGTAMRVISAMQRAYGDQSLPPIALLPFGTMNTTCLRVGAGGNPWWLLERILAERGTYRQQQFLLIEIDGTTTLAATMGIGLVSHFFEVYECSSSRGTSVALGIFAKVFFGSFVGHPFAKRILAAVPGRLLVEGQPMPIEAFTLLVCSVFENVGLGLRPTYRAATAAGRIHLVATDLAARRLGPQALRVLRAKPLRAPGLVDRLVTEFSLQFSVPTRVIADGECLSASQVRVRQSEPLSVWSP